LRTKEQETRLILHEHDDDGGDDDDYDDMTFHTEHRYKLYFLAPT
jgi:hypothetical protein